jgi:hypothetical protein
MIAVRPHVFDFWRRKLQIEFTERHWLSAREATREVRLRELQWKINHNIYPTNILLHKMKVTEDNKCSLCRNEIDFIEHFFFHCTPVNAFWKQVEHYLLGVVGEQIKLELLDILFGYRNNVLGRRAIDVVNNIILIGKMCISISKKTI